MLIIDGNQWKEKFQAQTSCGRNKIKSLGTPKDIQRQNLFKILTWLYRWGYSTAEILSDLLGRKNRSHAKRLTDLGWIQPVSIKGYPTYFVLTEKGLAESIHHSSALLEYKEVDPYRVHLPTLHHYLIAQRETITAIRSSNFVDYLTERMYKFKKEDAPLKLPDVILLERLQYESKKIVDEMTGVEIELTPKWNHHFDQFVTNIIDDIQFGRLRLFLIISDSKAILKRYEAAFQPGNKVKRWEKSPGGKFTYTGETLEIPEWVSSHIYFREVGSTESYPTVELL